MLGLGSLASAWLTWSKHRLAPMAAVATGCALLIWMSVEIVVVGYSSSPPLQPAYLVLGVALLGLGLSWWRKGG